MPFIPNTQVSSGATAHTYIGRTDIGGSYESMVFSRMYAKKVTLSQSCVILNVSGYVKGNGANVGALGAFVLADDVGTWGKILSKELTFQDTTGLTTTPGWLASPISLYCPAGSYWIGVYTNDSTNTDAMQLSYDSGGHDFTGDTGGAWIDDGGFITEGDSTNNYCIRASCINAV